MTRLAGAIAAVAIAVLAHGQTADGRKCYFRESPNLWILGNDRIEIRLDPRTGAISGLSNKRAGREFVGEGGSPEIFLLQYSTGGFRGPESRDVWNAVGGPYVRGSRQTVVSHAYESTANGGALEVRYGPLRLGRETLNADVRYRVELADGSEQTLWTVQIVNRTEGTLRDVLFPVISGLHPADYLLMPNQSGERLARPHEKVGEEHPVISLEYPARAAMQWFEVYSRDHGLYVGSYDRTLTYTTLNYGTPPGGAPAAAWIGRAAFVPAGGSWTSPPVAVAPHAGDWHAGADLYRAWLESWVKKPEVEPRIQDMLGGMREIGIRGTGEQPLHTYEDIATFAAEVANSPMAATFMVAGWLYNGHDTYFPDYRPIPDLGGAAALKSALAASRERGLAVSGYVNARLASHQSDTYKANGARWAALGKAPGLGVATIDTFELQEAWNKEWAFARDGRGRHAVMCPSASGWQKHIAGEMERAVAEYGFDGLFIDQPGSYFAELCFAPHHGHTTPSNAWGPGYLEIFRDTRQRTRRANPHSFLWTEGMNDVYNQYLDYTMDKGLVWQPMRSHPDVESFVEMWRYTLPWYVTGNHHGRYSHPASKDLVYGDGYFFVNGVRGIDRHLPKLGTPEQAQARAVFVDRMAELWKSNLGFLARGTFRDDVGLACDNDRVLAKLYRDARGRLAAALWNTGDDAAVANLRVDRARHCGSGTAAIAVKLAAHGVDLVEIPAN